MSVPTTMQDLSTTVASNSPGDTENPISMDDFFRALQSILRHTQAKGADIASATTTNLVTATGEFIDVTGTTPITGLGTVAAGIIRKVRFTGALTLTHNGTSLILPGAANITTAANDRAMFISLGSGNWFCFIYVKASGLPIVTTGLAASGANSDITSLTGLTTPVSLIALRSYLSGCALSTAGSSATMSIAAGAAMDSTNAYLMQLSAIAKTTSAWAVGTAQGGLDTGVIANSTWYHFYVIRRTDTGVVDVVFSTSASSPTLPTNYTQYRRIGAGKTNGSAQWTKFYQDGDNFTWDAIVADISATNPGTAAVTRTLTVPTGVNVRASFMASLSTGAGTGSSAIFSDLATIDATPATTSSMLSAAISGVAAGQFSINTNTSAQIRSRISASDANVSLYMNTLGWIDRRGRDA